MADSYPAPTDPDWFRAMVETARDFAIISLDPEGNIVTWNRGAEELFGHGEAEARGQPASLIFTPEDQAGSVHQRELTTAAREGSAEDDRWHVRRDGTRVWASGLLIAMRDEEALIRGFVKIVQDRTDDRRLEETLRASEEQYARVFIRNPAAIALERLDNQTFALANERFFQLTGYWRAEAMGRRASDLRLWADAGQRERALRELQSTGTCQSAEIDIRAKSGVITRCVAAYDYAELDGSRYLLGTYVPRNGKPAVDPS